MIIMCQEFKAFIKVNDEYFHWTTSNHIIERNSLSFNLFLIYFFFYWWFYIKFHAVCASCFRFKNKQFHARLTIKK